MVKGNDKFPFLQLTIVLCQKLCKGSQIGNTVKTDCSFTILHIRKCIFHSFTYIYLMILIIYALCNPCKICFSKSLFLMLLIKCFLDCHMSFCIWQELCILLQLIVIVKVIINNINNTVNSLPVIMFYLYSVLF